MPTKINIQPFAVAGLFAAIYGLISLVNHFMFRTAALDLGMFNHALHEFAHFNMPQFTLGDDGNEMPFLATHFSLLTAFYIPFYWLFGSYTLLIVQIVAIVFGGMGAYRYAQLQHTTDRKTPLIILLHFFSIWGIYSALSFDFHNNVVAAMLLPWFLLCCEKKQYKYSWLLRFHAQKQKVIPTIPSV